MAGLKNEQNSFKPQNIICFHLPYLRVFLYWWLFALVHNMECSEVINHIGSNNSRCRILKCRPVVI